MLDVVDVAVERNGEDDEALLDKLVDVEIGRSDNLAHKRDQGKVILLGGKQLVQERQVFGDGGAVGGGLDAAVGEGAHVETDLGEVGGGDVADVVEPPGAEVLERLASVCLLYTSDAADD